MTFFSRKKRRSTQTAEWLLPVVAGLKRRQYRLAQALARRTQYWSQASWILALIIFILLFGGTCCWLVVKAFIHD